jgi:benzoate/toluate 1,2-dioxygenase beta subunit
MFTADGRYWVPAAPDQLDPDTHVSLYYEDRLLMATRIKRLNHPRAYSLDGSSVRTSHLVGNVRIEGEDPGDGAVVVRSAFHMLEYRNEVQRMFGGFYTHRLMPTVAGFRIALKRVDLINCDAAFEALQVFL